MTPDTRPDICPEICPEICLEGRLLDDGRTGVSQYGARLAATLAAAGQPPLRLDATAPPDPAISAWARAKRYLRAARPGSRRLSLHAGATDGDFAGRLVGRDIFREAYLYFKFYGRLMPLTVDRPPGIMHWTYPLPLYLRGWRNIYTVHDIIPLQGEGLSPIRADRHERLLRRIAQRADRIVTVTQAVKHDVLTLLGCPPDFVMNSLQCVDLPLARAEPRPQDGPFLYCGAIEPRKNLVRLVDAYRQSGTTRPLLMVGPDGWRADDIRAQIGDMPGVTFLPFQPRDRLIDLIRGARALLLPSLAEGFGLPVAEAMTLGTPALISSTPALAEVAGAAGLAVDPNDTAAMSRAIAALDGDDALCMRMSALGVAKAVDYQPVNYLQRLHRIYADVARSSSMHGGTSF